MLTSLILKRFTRADEGVPRFFNPSLSRALRATLNVTRRLAQTLNAGFRLPEHQAGGLITSTSTHIALIDPERKVYGVFSATSRARVDGRGVDQVDGRSLECSMMTIFSLSALASMGDGVVITDEYPEKRDRLCQPCFSKMIGYDADELLGQGTGIFAGRTNPTHLQYRHFESNHR